MTDVHLLRTRWRHLQAPSVEEEIQLLFQVLKSLVLRRLRRAHTRRFISGPIGFGGLEIRRKKREYSYRAPALRWSRGRVETLLLEPGAARTCRLLARAPRLLPPAPFVSARVTSVGFYNQASRQTCNSDRRGASAVCPEGWPPGQYLPLVASLRTLMLVTRRRYLKKMTSASGGRASS